MDSWPQWAFTLVRMTSNDTAKGSRSRTEACMFNGLCQGHRAWQPQGRLKKWASDDELAAIQIEDQGKIPGVKVQREAWDKSRYL